jgi:uncharacterized protein (DUF885 family)
MGQAALEPRLDVEAFDDLVIADGSMPLPVLECRIDEWSRR